MTPLVSVVQMYAEMSVTRLALLIIIVFVVWPQVAWSQPPQQRLVRLEGGLTGVHDDVVPSAGVHVLVPLNRRQSARLDVGGFGASPSTRV